MEQRLQWVVQDEQIIVKVMSQLSQQIFRLDYPKELLQDGITIGSLMAEYQKGHLKIDEKILVLPNQSIQLELLPHQSELQVQEESHNPLETQSQEQKDEESKVHSTEQQVKQEEEIKRGMRPRMKVDKSKKFLPEQKEPKRKQKRMMKKPQKDDPRYRGVPKVKKIKKRTNKPKQISELIKRQAQIKREEQQYNKKIKNRGKKSFGNIKRKMKEYPKFGKKGKYYDIKLENKDVKLEDASSHSSSEKDAYSQSNKEGSRGSQEQQREIKRRVSRQQRQKQREEDQIKVQSIMKARGQRERREQVENHVRIQRAIIARFGKKMLLEINPNCKYYPQYKFRRGEIQKSGKLFCQIYNKHPVPPEGKHFFHMKILRLTFQSVTVGIITQDNFSFQYSRDKRNCICFDAYTHSTYIQGERTELQVQVKINDIIRAIVDIGSATIQWYINNDMISECIIPSHMVEVPLYPYIEISNKGIRLRINDFQE